MGNRRPEKPAGGFQTNAAPFPIPSARFRMTRGRSGKTAVAGGLALSSLEWLCSGRASLRPGIQKPAAAGEKARPLLRHARRMRETTRWGTMAAIAVEFRREPCGAAPTPLSLGRGERSDGPELGRRASRRREISPTSNQQHRLSGPGPPSGLRTPLSISISTYSEVQHRT